MHSAQVAEVVDLPYWREDQARVIVSAWRRDGGSLARFAERVGVDARRLGRWAARLKRTEARSLDFHPVRLTAAAEPRSDGIEIDLGDGRRIRVPRGFETEDLRRVLALLGGDATC